MKNLLLMSLSFLLSSLVMSQEKPPEIQDDYLTAVAGMEITISPMDNDFWMQGHDAIIYHATATHCNISYNDSLITVTPEIYFKDTLKIEYILKDLTNGMFSQSGFVRIYIVNDSYNNINVSNIDATIMGWGNHFYLPGYDGNPYFHVPKGKQTTTMFNLALWIAGLDQDSSYHCAGERYRQTGIDFNCGPIASVYDCTYMQKWHRVWKLNSSDIEYHRNNWWKSGYTPIKAIETWPGVFDNISKRKIAPFFDYNNDGTYNALDGDYPQIKGTQCIFFIYNDQRSRHSESQGLKLGIEIHGMAYAFDCIEDSALYNSLFFNYKIVNLSDTTYYNTRIGLFSDLDIGDPWDDYAYTDVYRNSIIGYNGKDYDGGSWYPPEQTFKDNPAAQSVTILAGPYIDNDNEDNHRFDGFGNLLCDEGVNGKNFQDGIIDNERYGINSSFILGEYTPPYDDPYYPDEYYNMMGATWKTGESIMYGANGYSASGAVGPSCKFMYPHNTDSINWGTFCNPPNGGFNTNGYYWNENTTANEPYDRHTILGTGDFTFRPGDIQEMDLALVFARDYSNPGASPAVELLKNRIDKVQYYFDNDSTPCSSGSFSAASNIISTDHDINIYPNPARHQVFVNNPESLEFNYSIIDLTGKEVQNGRIDEESETINISGLQPGMYFFRSQSADLKLVKKVIVK